MLETPWSTHERRFACSKEAHACGEMFGAHGRLEVGHGGAVALGIAGSPFGKKTDSEATEHAEDPDGIAVTDPAIIFAGGCVEALMQAGLDAPIGTVGREPLRCL